MQSPQDQARLLDLSQSLDRGESEALVLALEVGAEAVLIDEAAGREMATRMGLSPAGVLGILLKAKTRGSVPAIRPLLDNLRADLNFFISQDLYAGVLHMARESLG